MDKESIQKFRDELLEKLPEIVTRKQALDATGNLFSPRTMSNFECRNEGPRNKIKLGRQVAYRKEDFVDFIIGKLQEDDKRVPKTL